MKNFLNTLETKRAAAKEEGGFSLIDVVVTVAIIVALSVGGFIAYSGLVQNAKTAATEAAADQVYTASLVATNDGGIGDIAKVQADYNASSKDIKVAIVANADGTPKVTATHSNGTADKTTDDIVRTRG